MSILALSLLIGGTTDAALRRMNWRLEGYVAPAPAGTKPEAQLVLQCNGADYEFVLTKAVPTTPHVAPSHLAHDLQSHQNKLVLRGPAAMLHVLTTATPGEKLILTGFYRTGSGELLETTISTAAPRSSRTAK
jgi:hypothetical protein